MISCSPRLKSLGWAVVILALAGCASNAEFEAMRERAQKAERERDEWAAYSMRQSQYIRELENGAVLQAVQIARLRSNCEL